mgnify:FL=1
MFKLCAADASAAHSICFLGVLHELLLLDHGSCFAVVLAAVIETTVTRNDD